MCVWLNTQTGGYLFVAYQIEMVKQQFHKVPMCDVCIGRLLPMNQTTVVRSLLWEKKKKKVYSIERNGMEWNDMTLTAHCGCFRLRLVSFSSFSSVFSFFSNKKPKNKLKLRPSPFLHSLNICFPPALWSFFYCLALKWIRFVDGEKSCFVMKNVCAGFV